MFPMPEEYFKQKYKPNSIRLTHYDYSQNGYYFITICTKDKEHFFGKVVDKTVILSDVGEIAKQYWLDVPKHFPYVFLDECIVMPNHVHGIIQISNVETQNLASLQGRTLYKNTFGPQSKNLSSIIRGYKAGVKKWSTINEIDFFWQSGYYERVIRNDVELEKIKEYIILNPEQWGKEKNNMENLFI